MSSAVATRGTLLRMATAGSVDDGKSTLVGRLLHDSKAVLTDQLDAVERVSREKGLGIVDLALLTDGLRAEREQGITIDVAYRYFATAKRTFVLADCPGHVQYTRNTVTGSSTADVLVLLTDVRKGVLEQTRRHLAVAALLRVPHLVFAVNKIDLVDFDADRFATVAAEIAEVAAGLGIEDVRCVPVSALLGDNIVDRSERTPWYDGPSLLELLEAVLVDVGDHGCVALGRHAALVGELAELGADAGDGLGGGLGAVVEELDHVAGRGGDLGDAGTHGAGADDGDDGGGVEGLAHAHSPVNFGARFSMKAATPSA